MPHRRKNGAEMIAPDAYPQMMSRADAARALKTLRSGQVLQQAQEAMAAHVPPMHAAILDYVDALEAAGAEPARIYDAAHEIRGFAETAGLPVTGRVAENLCRYLETVERNGKPRDEAIVTLHVATIIRTARADRDDAPVADLVVDELTALVTRRLAEAGCA